MKKVLILLIACMLMSISYKAMAQDEEKIVEDKKLDKIVPDKKESQEIIIRKKGDKDANITINISGDKVTINGKPLVEFKDDAITINKRNVIVRDGDMFRLGSDLAVLEDRLGDMSWNFNTIEDEGGAFLGVTTVKDDKGAKITSITKESAAAKAGLKDGDIITKVGDSKIDDAESLSEAINAKKPKDEVKIAYLRDGKEKSVKATLQERKNSSQVFAYSSPDGSYKTLTIPQAKAYGEQLKSYNKDAYRYNLRTPKAFNYGYEVTGFPRKKLGLKIQDTEESTGVKVLEVEENSAAATAGVKKDDIVTEIGGVKVTNTDEVREQLQENSEKSTYNIKAKRNGTDMSFDIKIPKKLKTANL